MTSQTGKQTTAIHILHNISRSKSNQKIKFGQLIEYNTRYIFLKKSYVKYGSETIPSVFFKKPKLSISLDQWLNFIQSVFIVCKVEGYWNILKVSCRPLAFFRCLYFVRDCIICVCWPSCDVINFEINLIFLIKRFIYMAQKLNILRTKRAFKMK